MKKVFSSDNVVLVGHLHSILEANNIASYLRNVNLSGAIGELPLNECWPEIWVIEDRDSDIAKKLIDDTLSAATQQETWYCQCGETIEGQFQICWSCNTEKP